MRRKFCSHAFGAFDFPAFAVAAELTFVFKSAMAVVAAVRSDQFGAALFHRAQRREAPYKDASSGYNPLDSQCGCLDYVLFFAVGQRSSMPNLDEPGEATEGPHGCTTRCSAHFRVGRIQSTLRMLVSSHAVYREHRRTVFTALWDRVGHELRESSSQQSLVQMLPADGHVPLRGDSVVVVWRTMHSACAARRNHNASQSFRPQLNG
jgi:hypothetical protein